MVGYGDLRISGRPELTPLLRKYAYGGPGTMGPYWEEPGRSFVVGLYRAIIPPDALYTDVTRCFFPRKTESGEEECMVRIPKKMTIRVMKPYTRTWSAFHGWQAAHPDKKSRESGGEGDIVDEMYDEMKRLTGFEDDTEFDVDWSSCILLARKREDL